jgi:Zn-dependent protease with chaperone function
VRALFRRVPPRLPVEAELLAPADAPSLWQRVKELAARLNTEPPRAIVAGIDDNFFVTEQGLALAGGQSVEGRVLYLSLPLLRQLAPGEADAVFSHELAHFQGGDTEASAKLSPALVRYAQYEDSLVNGGLTLPAAFVMRLYRAVFELALKKEQRRRELRADAEAARLTSPDDVARSLLKVTGYSAFRTETERQLFEHRETHTQDLGLQARIDAGLKAHVASQGFLEVVKTLRTPHPFDSHPLLAERFANVKTSLRVEDAPRAFDERPAKTWADEVLTGAAIEQRLWAAYEARFKQNHELSLAFRYLPATDAERALVLRYFPDVRFPAKDGEVVVTHVGVTLPSGERFAFRDVEGAQVEDGTFSKLLVVTHREAGGGKAKTKVNLGHLKPRADEFQQAFADYWQRDQVARQANAR